MDNPNMPDMKAITEAAGRAGREFARGMRATGLAAAEACRRAERDTARQLYRNAGSPYGDSDEGARRWFEEGAALLCEALEGVVASSGTGKTDAEG